MLRPGSEQSGAQMIFSRKNKADEVAGTTGTTGGAPTEKVRAADPKPAAAETDDHAKDDTPRDWAAFDQSRDWREDGPYDFEEVDLEADDVERLDFGSLIITPIPGCELRMQVAEGTERILSVLVVAGESALELSAYSAPRTPGLWAETREQIIEQTRAAGGSADCVEGPFSTELVRNLPVQTPDGQPAIQPSRMWVVEGPRWLLRGILMGRAALSKEVDDDLVGPFYDVFADLVVRRGDHPMPAGELLQLQVPAEVEALDLDEAEG